MLFSQTFICFFYNKFNNSYSILIFYSIFAPQYRKAIKGATGTLFASCDKALPGYRDVAQLVAHYVRDVGVASSTLVIPTEKGKKPFGFFPFWFYWAN